MSQKLSRWLMLTLAVVGAASGLLATHSAFAGSALLRSSAVGGVTISVDGVLSDVPADDLQKSRASVEEFIDGPPTQLAGATEFRKVSLRRLEQVLSRAVREQGGQIPEEVRYLGGLVRLEYVLIYPSENGQPGDVVLAGPGEGWRVDAKGAVVGEKTGLPVLQLDDLLVAFRTVQAAQQGAVNCSINPTPEGVQNIERLTRNARFSPELIPAIEEAGGQQMITVDGVPETSHYARVMVAADYRMKRLAMQLDPSPVTALTSYLEMLQSSRVRLAGTAQPRWWLACNYEPLARSADGLAWKLRGPGVKVMTEDNMLNADGTLTARRGRTNPLAQKWADKMTAAYTELAQRDTVFAELRNIMDLSVVAALIEKEGLLEKAQLGQLSNILHDASPESYHAPKSLSTKCAIIKRGKDYIFMASGGVQVDSWEAASQSEVDAQLDGVRAKVQAPAEGAEWVWN